MTSAAVPAVAGVIFGTLATTPVRAMRIAQATDRTEALAAEVIADYPHTISKEVFPARWQSPPQRDCNVYRTTDDAAVVVGFYDSEFRAHNRSMSYCRQTFRRVTTVSRLRLTATWRSVLAGVDTTSLRPSLRLGRSTALESAPRPSKLSHRRSSRRLRPTDG